MSKERIILAADPAKRSGFALGSTTRGYLASTMTSSAITLDRDGLPAAFDRMRSQATQFVRNEGFDSVDLFAFEKPTPKGYPTANVQFAFLLAARAAAYDLGAARKELGFAPSTVKKIAAGHGRADKEAMIVRMSQWSGKQIEDDNEADAVAVLKCALIELADEQKRLIA